MYDGFQTAGQALHPSPHGERPAARPRGFDPAPLDKVEYTEKAKRNLKKMDKPIAKLINAWIRKNLEGCENPRVYGKGLTAHHSGKWRYRVGDYRITADIQDEKIIILVLEIGHRSGIY